MLGVRGLSLGIHSSAFAVNGERAEARTGGGAGAAAGAGGSRRAATAPATLNRNNGSSMSISGPLKNAARKTLDVVYVVETAPEDRPEILRKSTRLIASTLLDALDVRIQRLKWQEALKVFTLLRQQEWYEPDLAKYVKLIDMLGTCKQPDAAFSIFKMMLEDNCYPSVEAFTALLTAYTRSNCLDHAFSVMNEMKKVPDCEPDLYTYSELIRACSEASLFTQVNKLLLEMEEVGLRPNTVTFNILLDAYGKVGMLEEMESLFTRMVESQECEPDTWTYNVIIKAFARSRNIEGMELWYKNLLRVGCEPDVVTFNTLLTAYGKDYLFDKVEAVLDYMHKYHFRCDTVTYNIVIDAYGKAGWLQKVRETYREMLANGVRENCRTFCSLIDAFGKQGIWSKVEKFLRQMRNSGMEPDTAVYNAALDAYRKGGKEVEMYQLLLEMESRGCQADAYTRSILQLALMKRKNGSVQL